ncbi:MAG: class I SAM-dependent methyltransferase, partial [Candidatus Omnitrophica bacterium]|nr:class I SAM-dependent methyltransferase [Candidatus Omnitrophota bacterium]
KAEKVEIDEKAFDSAALFERFWNNRITASFILGREMTIIGANESNILFSPLSLLSLFIFLPILAAVISKKYSGAVYQEDSSPENSNSRRNDEAGRWGSLVESPIRQPEKQEDELLIFIGDVHSNASGLINLLNDIHEHYPSGRRIYLGDYYDSERYFEPLETWQLLNSETEAGSIFLLGDHDYALWRAVDRRDIEAFRFMLNNRGLDTLKNIAPGIGSRNLDSFLAEIPGHDEEGFLVLDEISELEFYKLSAAWFHDLPIFYRNRALGILATHAGPKVNPPMTAKDLELLQEQYRKGSYHQRTLWNYLLHRDWKVPALANSLRSCNACKAAYLIMGHNRQRGPPYFTHANGTFIIDNNLYGYLVVSKDTGIRFVSLEPNQVRNELTVVGQEEFEQRLASLNESTPTEDEAINLFFYLLVLSTAAGILIFGIVKILLTRGNICLKEKIIRSINKNGGRITFEQFQRLAAVEGYYKQGKARFGFSETDGVTFNTDASGTVALALARLFYDFWKEIGRPENFDIVEQGAGDGSMAQYILDVLKEDPGMGDFYSHVRYTIVDISGYWSRKHEERLRYRHANVQHKTASVFNMPFEDESIEGVLFSNELPDSFPVHRVVVRNNVLKEIYVTYDGKDFKEEEGSLSTDEITKYFELVGKLPPEGKEFAVNLGLFTWMREVNRVLKRGFVVTSDYGFDKTDVRYNSAHKEAVWNLTEQPKLPILTPGIDITHNVDFETLDKIAAYFGLIHDSFAPFKTFLAAFSPIAIPINEEEFILTHSKGMAKANWQNSSFILPALLFFTAIFVFSVFMLYRDRIIRPREKADLNADNSVALPADQKFWLNFWREKQEGEGAFREDYPAEVRDFVIESTSLVIGNRKKPALLDIGAGADLYISREISKALPNVKVYALDLLNLDPRVISGAEKITYIQASADATGFPSHYFSAAVMVYAIDYWNVELRNAAINELLRILRGNFKVIIVLHHPESFTIYSLGKKLEGFYSDKTFLTEVSQSLAAGNFSRISQLIQQVEFYLSMVGNPFQEIQEERLSLLNEALRIQVMPGLRTGVEEATTKALSEVNTSINVLETLFANLFASTEDVEGFFAGKGFNANAKVLKNEEGRALGYGVVLSGSENPQSRSNNLSGWLAVLSLFWFLHVLF